ncbi:MAG: vWA domain-containing protein [Planctomycetota bacterium]
MRSGLLPRLLMALLLPCLLVWAAAGCGEPLSPANLTTSYDAHGQTMLFVVDTSGSMTDNDPLRLTGEAAQVALAIANTGDNIGVISFSGNPIVQIPMQKVTSFADRSRLQAEMRDVAKYRNGGTNYSGALNLTKAMLSAAHANPDSNVVFMTDGKPDDTAEDIDRAVIPFVDNRWRINTIGLTADSDNDSLSSMQAQTGGAKKVVLQARDLLECYLKLALSTNNYWEFSGAANNSPMTLLPGAKRLIYIGVRAKDDPTADLAGVIKDGHPLNLAPKTAAGQVFRYPPAGAGQWPTTYQVINIQQPDPGVYQPEVHGQVDIFKVMMEPPYDFNFTGATPPPVFYGSDPIDVEVAVSSSSPEGLDYFEKQGEIGLSAAFDSDHTLLCPYTIFTEHSRQTVDGKPVIVYKHTFSFSPDLLGQKDRQVRLTLVGTVHAAVGSDGVWTSERTALIQYRPGGRIHPLVFAPAKTDLGDLWSDQAPAPVKLTLRAIHGDQVQFSIGVEPKDAKVTVTPADGSLKAQQEQPVEAKADFRAATPGPQAIKLTATPTGVSGTPAPETADIAATVYKLTATPVDLGQVRADEKVRSKEPLAIAIEPARDFTVHFEPTHAEKQGIFQVVKEDGKLWLAGTVPANAQGDLSGSLVIAVPGSSLPVRKVPVQVSLQEEHPAFADIAGLQKKEDRTVLLVDAHEAGVSSSTVSFTPKGAAGAQLKVSLVSLTDRNNHPVFSAAGEVPALTYSLPDGVDPAHLVDGKAIDLKYKVFVSSDIPADTYQGKLVLQMVRDGKTVVAREIPIEVDVGASH